jgi:predicted alpha/beta superfamily hydrolase
MKKLLILLFVTTISFSQNKMKLHFVENTGNFEGTIERIDSFPSKNVKTRTVDVWLPKEYTATKKYSVLYMHDGQMLFDATTTWNKQEWKVDEVVSKLIEQNKIEDIIVVAIWNIPNLRHFDLYPKKPYELLSKVEQENVESEAKKLNFDWNVSKINSDNYLKFIVEEIKPYIDKKYSVYTDNQHTAIMGSSMGGLISMYAICEYPEVFGKAACLSTHWIGFREFENNPIPESFFAYMEKHLPIAKKHKIYFDYGTETLDADYVKYEYRVDEILKLKDYTEVDSRNLQFEGENHSEASWQKRIDIPLVFMFGK